jgi:diacylglycerol kinase (ATP)
MKKKSKSTLKQSFGYAFNGLKYSFNTQRNIGIHFVIAALVIVASFYFKISGVEAALVCVAIALVIITELINTAIEKAIDVFTDDYNINAKIAKDVAAAAVLFSSAIAVVIGFIVFFDKVMVFLGL